MEENEQQTHTPKGLIIAIVLVLVAAIGALLVFNLRQHRQMQEMVEELEFEKEAIQDEYEDLAIQFDGYQKMDIQNDSLQDQLAKEQQRVRDLLEELRITKVTNARRISELKKELATVRAVMVSYVHQIDSLNQTNQRLTEENQQIRKESTKVKEENSQLSTINFQLSQVVTRAAMLEVSDCVLLPLNKRDRKTSLFSQIKKLQFNYAIQKNITCEPGEKTVYLSLRQPDGEVLQRDTANVFEFENNFIPYSVKQQIEYAGEELTSTMYWSVADELQQGTYTADFFIDGNLCGSFNFELKK